MTAFKDLWRILTAYTKSKTTFRQAASILGGKKPLLAPADNHFIETAARMTFLAVNWWAEESQKIDRHTTTEIGGADRLAQCEQLFHALVHYNDAVEHIHGASKDITKEHLAVRMPPQEKDKRLAISLADAGKGIIITSEQELRIFKSAVLELAAAVRENLPKDHRASKMARALWKLPEDPTTTSTAKPISGPQP
jgi:hypothetical protein